MDEFLSKKLSNVVYIHCLAGKGRSASAICCYLLYSGRFDATDDAINYYIKKRLHIGGGLTLPI